MAGDALMNNEALVRMFNRQKVASEGVGEFGADTSLMQATQESRKMQANYQPKQPKYDNPSSGTEVSGAKASSANVYSTSPVTTETKNQDFGDGGSPTVRLS